MPNVFYYICSRRLVKFCHLLLRKPHSFILKPDINFCKAIFCLVNYNIALILIFNTHLLQLNLVAHIVEHILQKASLLSFIMHILYHSSAYLFFRKSLALYKTEKKSLSEKQTLSNKDFLTKNTFQMKFYQLQVLSERMSSTTYSRFSM